MLKQIQHDILETYHKSVLLTEAIDALQIKRGEQYIDATLGGGGHTETILTLGGRVLGIDVDQEAISYVEEKLKNKNEKLKIVRGNFRNIDQIAKGSEFGSVAGILFDLGVSSHQFDTSERGFSFRQDAPLDMRMDTSLGVTAKDILLASPKTELMRIFTEYGEERFAGRIADGIVRRRKIKPIEKTKELEALIRSVVPKGTDSINPATRVFQALRISVNMELDSLSDALPKAYSLLKTKGRIVVISFHSLEDRIVKHTFIDWEKKKKGNIITAKPIVPTESEIKENVRSRSAKMRVFEKL